MQIFSGHSMTFRFVVPDAVNSFQIPADVQWVLLSNIGSNDIRFNFDDDGPSDYRTIKAGKELPPIRVQGGTNFNTDGVNGSSTLEVVAWG